MRVMILSSASVFDGFPYGGAESSLALIGTEMHKQGHAVTFAAFSRIRRGENWFPHVRHMDHDGIPVALFRPMTGTALKAVRAVNASRFAAMVRRVCRRDRIDVIYCTYEPEVLQAALAARRANPGLRVVMRMAGLAWYENARGNAGASAMYERFFSGIDAINFLDDASKDLTTERMAELGLGQGRDTSRDFTLDIGIDTSRMQETLSQAPVAEAGPEMSLVMVARFSDYQKRQDILVRAVALARGQVPLRLRLIGGSPESWGRITALIDDLNLKDCVTLHSFMPQKELWHTLATTDLVCHACDYEGVSKAILEAMATGRPVLASDVSPLNRMIDDGQTGYLAANTPEDWARKLTTLYENPRERQATGKQAQIWVRETHALPVRAAAYADALADLKSVSND